MNKAESAELILRLYELRREEKMREARNWMAVQFMPESFDDIRNAIVNIETSAKFRMVSSYWEMAATFVVQGAIDLEMFFDANSEHVVCYCKLEPYLQDLRQMTNNPRFFINLEKMFAQIPGAKEMLHARRETLKRWAAARAQATAQSPAITN